MKKLLVILILCVIIANAGSCGSSSAVPAGNIANYGYVLVDGNNIYFTRMVITDFANYSNIYRLDMRTPQAEPLLIAKMEVEWHNEMSAFLTLHNGYLYFLPYFLHESMNEVSPNIYRVRADGQDVTPEPMLEQDAAITFMQIAGGLIYFYDENAGEHGTLYSMRPDGSNREIVLEAFMQAITIGGNDAFFIDEDMVLRSVSLRGGEPREIFNFLQTEENEEEEFGVFPDNINNILADGNYIYYLDEDGLFVGRIRTNGTNNEIIYAVNEESSEFIAYFNVSGDTLFMVMGDYGAEFNFAIIAVSTRGGGTPRVVVSPSEDLGDIMPISIWGNVIYFAGMPIYETIMDSDYVWFSVRKEGGRPVAWQPFSIFDEAFGGWDDWDWDWDD